jgi:hypothetical protein
MYELYDPVSTSPFPSLHLLHILTWYIVYVTPMYALRVRHAVTYTDSVHLPLGTVMFFWRNKHIQVDFGTGNNNKINFPVADKQDLIDVLEVAYKAASKGKGLAVSPKDWSTKWMY